MKTPPRFAIDAQRFPFRSHWATLSNGAAIHYVDEGQGPVILLLHGNPTWSFLYRKIIAGLRDRFRLIAPDYPGFGLSTPPAGYGFSAAEQADSLAAFVAALELKHFAVMMQDWGGPIGFSLALREPRRVTGLIIGNTWAWPLERFGQKMFSRIMGGPVGRFLARSCNGVVYFFMTQGVVRRLAPEILAMYRAPFQNPRDRAPTHIFPRQLREAAPFLSNIRRNLPTLADKPALILWGLKDFAFQTPELTRFEALFPDHRTVPLPRAGHFIQEDAPDDIVRAVRNWFADRGMGADGSTLVG
jgi:haloalkane dehalogenase